MEEKHPLITLASQFRYLQLLAHNAHNEAKGPTSIQDHGFLGDLYPIYDKHYDSLVERVIGSGGSVDLVAIQQEAASRLVAFKSTDEALQAILDADTEARDMIEDIVEADKDGSFELSQGTIDLLAGIADQCEGFQKYWIQQRLVK
jgi:DNA-binding ferritin-like protein